MKTRWLVALGFLGAILVGTLLLWLPPASPAPGGLSFGDALFTACSAVCITGLTVIEPGLDLTTYGQVVLMILVELGCIGIMTLGTFFLVVTGRRLSLANEFSVMNAYGTHGVRGLRGLIVWIVGATLFIEALGAVSLWASFTRDAADWSVAWHDTAAWYRAVFYAVMAFANAGFSLDAGSLAVFRSQPAVLCTLGFELILGGLGFLVIYNVCTIRFWTRNLVRRGRLTLHTRVVLRATFFFTLVAFLAFLVGEGAHALRGMPWADRIAVAFFQAVTPRTCGFTVVPVADMYDATHLLTEVLMFIGAAPGGAGGGIKVTTFAVFLCTVAAIYRGRSETVIRKRSLSMEAVREAFVIFTFTMAVLVVAMFALLMTEAHTPALTFERLLFEVVSAVSTTGLSYGDTTAQLSALGRGVIMACMIFGRFGAITVVLLIAGRDERATVLKYPREELIVG